MRNNQYAQNIQINLGYASCFDGWLQHRLSGINIFDNDFFLSFLKQITTGDGKWIFYDSVYNARDRKANKMNCTKYSVFILRRWWVISGIGEKVL